MKSSLRLSVCLAATAAALFAAGCAKKPIRPNPYDTVISGQGSLSPSDATFLPGEGNIAERPNDDPAARADFSQFGPVYFDFDSATIRIAERSKVEAVANHLNSNPNARLVLRGHCDWRGTTDYNLGLGDRRASAVRDYLATFGIPAARLQTVSRGDLDAKESATDAEMQQDRRVDLGVY